MFVHGPVLCQETFRRAGYAHAMSLVKPDLFRRAGAAFTQAYSEASLAAHAGPTVRLDPEHVKAWSPEAAAKLDVAPTGLSRTACLCTTCPYFLKCLGDSNRPGRASPALKAHLECVPVVPGLHKYLFETGRKLAGEAAQDYLERVEKTVKLGWHLELHHPERMERLSLREAGERDEAYGKGWIKKIQSEFGEPGKLEAAVAKVAEWPVLGREETLELLALHYQA